MCFRLYDLDIVLGFRIKRITLGCDAVPIQLTPFAVFTPIHFMDLQNGTLQVVGIQLFESLNDLVNLTMRQCNDWHCGL